MEMVMFKVVALIRIFMIQCGVFTDFNTYGGTYTQNFSENYWHIHKIHQQKWYRFIKPYKHFSIIYLVFYIALLLCYSGWYKL